MCQPLFPIDYMLRPGVALLCQQRRKHSRLGRQGIYRIFHHGQVAGGNRTKRAGMTGGDADSVLDLLPGEMQRPTGDDRRNECGECGMVPSALANAGKSRFAEPHLELVAEHEPDNEFFAPAAGTLAASNCCRENIRWMRRILLPIDVVVRSE